jgi:hypothetical protein
MYARVHGNYVTGQLGCQANKALQGRVLGSIDSGSRFSSDASETPRSPQITSLTSISLYSIE